MPHRRRCYRLWEATVTFMKLMFLSMLGMTEVDPCASEMTGSPSTETPSIQGDRPLGLMLLSVVGMTGAGPCASEMTRQATSRTPLTEGDGPLDLIKIGGSSPRPINN